MTDPQCNGRRTFLAALFLVAVTIAVYWPARHFDFVDYDDDSYVVDNPPVTAGLSGWGITWAFVDQHAGNWHPLTWISHMVDCQLFGVNAGPAHFENVLIHCASAVLLLLLLNAMMRPHGETAMPAGIFWRNAFVAALFALHPLRVESVAWISERKDVLSGLFFMLTLWFYIQYANQQRDDSPATKPSRTFYRWSIICFALGLLSKPSLVTVPLILLLLDFWPLGRTAGTVSKNPVMVRNLLLEKWPFLLLSFLVGCITLWAQRSGGGWTRSDTGIFLRAGNVIVNYAGYLGKLLWPQNLSFLYLRPDHLSVGQLVLSGLVLSVIILIVVRCRRRQPWLAVGGLWFLIMLLPVSGLFELARLSIADRYTYLPSIGFYLALTWAVAGLMGAVPLPRVRQAVTFVGASAVLGFCLVLTQRQLATWENTQTLMEHALQVDPDNYVAKHNLHIYLLEKAHPELKRHQTDANKAAPAK